MQEKDWQDIFFLVPGGMEKSNPWIFFVFWKHLKDRIPNSATCHFISDKRTSDINSKSEAVTKLLQNTRYKDENSLVFIFDDMAYSGTQMKTQLNYFDTSGDGYPPNLYIIMPYLTHTAKRKITGMDPTSKQVARYYTQEYVNGLIPHHKYKNETEKTWFAKSPVQFMPSTQVIQEILITKEFLGSNESITTPTALPFKIADHVSVLCGVIAYGIYPMKDELTQAEVNKFKPMSLFQGHAYTSEQEKKIRDEIFTTSVFGTDTFEQEIPCELSNDLLPIKALYKNRTFTFKVKENNTIVEKQYSNTKELKRHGVFEVIKKKLAGT